MGRKRNEEDRGKLSRYVNTPEAMAVFRHLYEIPNNVGLRIVMETVELNRRLGLELSTYDIVRTYILHHNSKTESYSLRPRDINFTLVNGLPNTNRGFDDDYLVVSGEWFLPGLKCPTKDGVPDPKRRNPRKNLIKINSLCQAWESELCTDDYGQPLMGTKVGLVLKILCKFQMGQLQDQEPRRSRKQCKDWCNPLGMKLARAQQSKWV
uniref:Uncharacterized protein n=1 Tax=Fagus sylvatica TaxID=28930 RepID=A0A2N9IQE4_FAGSY